MATHSAIENRRSPHVCAVTIVLASLLATPAAWGQEHESPRLLLSGIQPGGVRATVTEAWGKLDFVVTNLTATDRKGRVLAFYENDKDAQYGRDLWVPANATVASWLPLGPAPAQASTTGRDLQLLLYDLRDGKEELQLPSTPERVRRGAAIYRKRESDTALVIDEDPESGPVLGQLPLPEAPAEEATKLVRAFRATRKLSNHVHIVGAGAIPAWPKAFDGIDHLVIGTARLTHDPAAMRALRHWVEQGGQLWVMLDRVAPAAIAPLLGESLDFEVVGRVGLTDFRIDDRVAIAGAAEAPTQRHERPVDLVRVLLPQRETARHTIAGWPAWFSRSVGRGTILFTTLGPRGWYQPKKSNAHEASEALIVATEELQTRSVAAPPAQAFESLLTEEIGYAIVGRGTVLAIFVVLAAGILGLTLLGVWLQKPAWLGWAAPAAALVAAGVFLVIGEMARRAAPPTVAFVQVLDAVAGTDELAVRGVMAVYRPDSGPIDLGAAQGGFFDLDLAGIEGQTRRLVMTDMDAWHWENLALPAGVRFAPLQFTARSEAPLDAVARFGPDGITGTVTAKGIGNLADGLVNVPGARNLAIRFGPGTEFSASSADLLPSGQFLAGTLLSDRQQRRQEIYRRFLMRSVVESSSNRPMLMAWSSAVEMPFRLPTEMRLVGTALLSVPLRLERSDPGTRVTIPGAFVPARRVLQGKFARLQVESNQETEQDLQFQLPRAVLPLKVESARLVAKIDAGARRVTVAGRADGAFVELHREENPLGPIQLDIADTRFLRLDTNGGFHLRVSVSETLQKSATADGPPQWRIEYIELEVGGTTETRGAR
jgi:hypothetical protein